MRGLLLALQFFTIFPIRKELSLDRKGVTSMFIINPWVGASIGLLMFATSKLFLDVLETGTLLAAVFIVLTGIVCTGGLHIDGFADTSDALFSYRDQTKRHEILEDPKLGAFGTMAIILIIVVKIALIEELLTKGTLPLVIFIAIPFMARAAMNIYMILTKLAKENGLAFFFKEKLFPTWTFTFSIVWCVLAFFTLGIISKSISFPLVLAIILVAFIFIFRKCSLKQFGGVTGDLLGAFIVGLEGILWLVLLLFY